jgi:hypothetical protein
MMIAGPGGIGKTTVAQEVAERVIAGDEHGRRTSRITDCDHRSRGVDRAIASSPRTTN